LYTGFYLSVLLVPLSDAPLDTQALPDFESSVRLMSNPKQPCLIRYSYDSLDKLISHSLSDTPERHRFYCKNRLTTEIQGAIEYSIVQHGDFLLAQQKRQQDGHDTTLLATDLQRSVLNTLMKNTERQTGAYSPYGYRHAEKGLTSLLAFNGERPDPETEHYLLGNGYRAFNPVLMRFNSPDSLSPFGKGGFNTYAYCKGDPVNFVDPTGHFLKLLKKPFQSIANKINKTKLNKEIDNVISNIQADSFKFNKETARLQAELIYSRHPTGLKVGDPQSLTSIALKAVQPHQLSELSPGIVNRDIAREIFFEELHYNGPITNSSALDKIFTHLPKTTGGQLSAEALPSYSHAHTTSFEVGSIAFDRNARGIPFDIAIENANLRKGRKYNPT
jgi:RHS repeat-associated protein